MWWRVAGGEASSLGAILRPNHGLLFCVSCWNIVLLQLLAGLRSLELSNVFAGSRPAGFELVPLRRGRISKKSKDGIRGNGIPWK